MGARSSLNSETEKTKSTEQTEDAYVRVVSDDKANVVEERGQRNAKSELPIASTSRKGKGLTLSKWFDHTKSMLFSHDLQRIEKHFGAPCDYTPRTIGNGERISHAGSGCFTLFEDHMIVGLWLPYHCYLSICANAME